MKKISKMKTSTTNLRTTRMPKPELTIQQWDKLLLSLWEASYKYGTKYVVSTHLKEMADLVFLYGQYDKSLMHNTITYCGVTDSWFRFYLKFLSLVQPELKSAKIVVGKRNSIKDPIYLVPDRLLY